MDVMDRAEADAAATAPIGDLDAPFRAGGHAGPAGTESGRWNVVRDANLIGVVDYDTLVGVARAGTGIAGA